MNEISVTITLEEYTELLRAQEKIAVVERLINKNIYVSTGEICAALDIKYPEERKS